MAAIVVDSGVVGVSGAPLEFRNTLTRDGAVYDLTAKTVTASVRRESAPYTVVDVTLEDITVTLGNPTVLTAAGGVTLILTAGMMTLLVPTAAVAPLASQVERYLVQYKVTTDNYYPQALRFAVRKGLD